MAKWCVKLPLKLGHLPPPSVTTLPTLPSQSQQTKVRLIRNSLVAQWVKDPVLSLWWWLQSLLWCGLIPDLGTSTCPRCGQKKKKKKKSLVSHSFPSGSYAHLQVFTPRFTSLLQALFSTHASPTLLCMTPRNLPFSVSIALPSLCSFLAYNYMQISTPLKNK